MQLVNKERRTKVPCPFCSGDLITVVSYRKTRAPVELDQKPAEFEAFCQCDHCMAEGSHFIDLDVAGAEVSALAAWEGKHTVSIGE